MKIDRIGENWVIQIIERVSIKGQFVPDKLVFDISLGKEKGKEGVWVVATF